MGRDIREGNYGTLGVIRQQDRVIFTFCGEKEDQCYIVLLHRASGSRMRIEVPQEFCRGSLRSIEICGLKAADYEYYYEINGEKVMDPYARRVVGREVWNDKRRKACDYEVCAGFVEEKFDWRHDCAPEIEGSSMFMYKLHVRGFTMEAGGKHPGTFAALMNKIGYLQRFGVTTLELMPVYEFEEMPVPLEAQLPDFIKWEPRKEDKIQPMTMKECQGRLNYWGYGPGNYFAVKSSYASDPEHAAAEYKTLIRRLHEHGMECVMEMYFPEDTNHNMILDALRYWVLEYHVDGFHLLGDSIPVTAIVQDSLLSRTKIFCESFGAEPAARGNGYRSLYVYKDEYMYPARCVINHINGNMRRLVDQQRKQGCSHGFVNYISSNNGFTLADLFMYNDKHNEDNGEANQDGSNWNFSNNYGIEGPTRRKYINFLRRLNWRNSLLMLFFAQGVPLLWAGDEIGNSQQGNNNAYCQDNPVGWLNWRNEKTHRKELEFLRQLVCFRKEHPILANEMPFQFCDYLSCGYPDLSFHGESAWVLEPAADRMCIGMLYCGAYSPDESRVEDVYVAYNFYSAESKAALPKLAPDKAWFLVLDSIVEPSFLEAPVRQRMGSISMKPQSICVLVSRNVEPVKEIRRTEPAKEIRKAEPAKEIRKAEPVKEIQKAEPVKEKRSEENGKGVGTSKDNRKA